MKFYLDSNAHVQLNSQLLKIDSQFSDYLIGNPFSYSQPGRQAASLIEASREKIAELLGAEKKEQIIFTRGTSQAIEWGLEIFAQITQEQIYYSDLEHFAVIDKIEQINHRAKINQFTKLNLNSQTFDVSENQNKIVHLLAHNEVGIIYQLKPHIKYLADCAQIIGKMPFHFSNYPQMELGIFSPHKFGAPSGIGILYLKNIENWQEFGAGSRYGFDISGTPDVFSIVATAEILNQVITEQDEKIKNMQSFQKTIEDGLYLLDCSIIGAHLPRLPNTTFFRLPEKWSTPEKKFALFEKLEEKNIFPGLGSACGSVHNFENRFMKSIGYPSSADNYLRISTFGEYNSNHANQILNVFSDIFSKDEN